MLPAAPLFVVALASAPLAALLALASGDAALACARAARALGVGAVASVLLLVAGGAAERTELGPFQADPFAALVLVLVLGVGATVLSYAGRSLRHEPYQRRFAVAGAAVAGTAASVAAAEQIGVLALAWVATSAATVALVRTGPDAGRAARSTRLARTFLLADVLVVAGLALLVANAGTTRLGAVETDGGWGAVAGILLVLGAAARSSAAPFHRWLPDTLGAPTPSSALLHAGVVNGGAILLLTTAPAISGHLAPAIVAVVLGSLSCAFAEAVMLTRPDVKGRLAWSTIAQMSFTLVLCGLGLSTAAALHLVAHGLYKGALFLGSGSAVRGIVRDRRVPGAHRAPGVLATLATTALVVTAAALAIVLTGAEVSANLLVPVGLACTTAVCAARGWMGRAADPRQALAGVVGAAGLVAAFVVVTVALKHRIGPSLPEATAALPAALVLATIVLLVAVAWSHAHPSIGSRAWAAAHRAGRPTPVAARQPGGGARVGRPIPLVPSRSAESATVGG